MVKILSIFVAAFAASHVADAGECTPGLKYCGKTLIQYGNFEPDQLAANFLYYCHPNFAVSLIQRCGFGCASRGVGKNDACYRPLARGFDKED
ncbi:hypothetical protein E4U09_001612 [Claviceps aff. purpurea]|uniref:Uncharacterized protein n=1 Tax=Claviceps aff. purpurea TaxID=1967640 RepID=A0A9P7QLZ5_9HYPO|nr:hypothetical protein E4U09_001612 [Claviceps aff. purpurea]